VSTSRVAALQKRILDWYAANGRDLPWRRTVDPYAILVSEVMLQQTQVARVVPRYGAFLERYPTLADLAAAPLAGVLELWLGLGYNTRAVRLKRCAELAGERLPETLDELQRLPGLGPYTARAVLIFAHNADLAAVDANVRRVLIHELDLSPGIATPALQQIADEALPTGRSRDWHNALMDYGALVLTGRATGIASTSRQSGFEGSRRQKRARIVRLAVERGTLSEDEIATELGLDSESVNGLLSDLSRDGLVALAGGRVRLA
jgi:A/G-specific adenine glycosylase